ncbi:MAG: hypothetical protein U5S82_02010 [Gammaproteobacteria bacterium]|nr:hypothetical protein [Gammaproteobacteria bacterium]
MESISFEQWLHASDAERNAILAQWQSDPEAGRSIVAAVARLFQKECIYEVNAAEIAREGASWLINAYIDTDDYALLSKRKLVKFLGIPIRFHESRGPATSH